MKDEADDEFKMGGKQVAEEGEDDADMENRSSDQVNQGGYKTPADGSDNRLE